MIGTIQGPVSTPAKSANILYGIQTIEQLLKEARFVAKILEDRKLLDL